MRLKLLSIIVVCCVMVYVDVSNGSGAKNMRITNEQAIAIASKEAVRLGYAAKDMNVEATLQSVPWNRALPRGLISEYDPEHQTWNEILPEGSTSEYDRERQNRLKGKEYWAVCYYPRPSVEGGRVKGGDICIFIDSRTREILADYRGE